MVHETDVTVIGAGMSGVSTAYHLAEGGVDDVVLLEKDGPASKASGRAAGSISGDFFNEYSVGTDIIDYSFEFYRELEAMSDKLDLHSRRGYTMSHTAEGREILGELHLRSSSATEMLSPDELEEREPHLETEGVTAILAFEEAPRVDPYTATTELLSVATDRGVEFRTEEVADVSKESGEFVVETDAETYRSETVVNTAGVWARVIANMVGVDFPFSARPSEAIVMRTEEDLDFPEYNCPDIELYGHKEPNGDIFVGKAGHRHIRDLEAFSTDAEESTLQYVAKHVHQVSEKLTNAEVVNHWGERCQATPDRHPLLGETEVDGFYLICGLNGTGIMHGPFYGRVIADLVRGEDPEETFDVPLDFFDPHRFADADEEDFEIKNAIDW
ncbi:FAD-binding oxidoreductase [Haloarculaceae archaeon H-GB2-1]|nr:FAD-binding oxidoreductase [Haloarculaceae archaeon H-GB1-1]MEA5388009.1 FAD-binding oxidoreductase [Haloarculaceae archaeon H-GB11]MEA5409496.1 FAD-binding oxidoreductase [Haloarculaceae archaeon H-GB2-1]